jgi:hypothetical protein
MHGDEVGPGGLLHEFWEAAQARTALERRWVVLSAFWCLCGCESVLYVRVYVWYVFVLCGEGRV